MSAFADQGAVAAMLADGRRLHLQHGPIDLIVEAFGAGDEVKAAYRQARAAFRTVLADLVGELGSLRAATSPEVMPPGPVAERMWCATLPFCTEAFITPMAAVAGAVSDHLLAAMIAGRELERAYVNNGGDIALYLADGRNFEIAVCVDPRSAAPASTTRICAKDAIGGVATSGWLGRSHSLGIADAVTVLAGNAASADAAATLIANAVGLPGSSLVSREVASRLSPDSDLGERRVTVGVAALSQPDIDEALDRGLRFAACMRDRGLISSAFLVLQGSSRVLPDHEDQGPLTSPGQRAGQIELEVLHA